MALHAAGCRRSAPARSRLRRSAPQDSGFTLIELSVVMTILGVVMAMGAFGFSSWQHTSRHQGSATELVSELRNASVRAISEGRTYCVDVKAGGRSYELWQYSCGGAGSSLQGSPQTVQGGDVTVAVTVTSPGSPTCPATSTCLYFFPRGTASEATLVVESTKRSKKFTVEVEGLTSRVFM